MQKYNLQYHLYADDTQLYLSFKPGDTNSIAAAKTTIEQCVTDIKQWMSSNMLKLNQDKTEVLVLTTNKWKNKCHLSDIEICAHSIKPTDSVRNLGAYFDRTLSAEAHVNKASKAAQYHLYNMSRVRRSLTKNAAKTLVHAFVTSRLDYCNSLLHKAPSSHISRLQKVQNYAARIVAQVRKYDHISPVLAGLHWLPVQERIEFKVLMYTYKALHGVAPSYLSELLHPYVPNRHLRSADKDLLVIPKTRLTSYGDRAFSASAPCLWNRLPVSIKESNSVEIFKKRLKTHLFEKAFSHYL